MELTCDLPAHKVLLLGDFGVGKSSLALQFVYSKFVDDERTPSDSYRKTIVVTGQPCHADILDVMDKDDSAGILTNHVRNGEGFLCTFDLADKSTFANAVKYRELIWRVKGGRRGVPVVLVGNKVDLTDRRGVSELEARALASTWGVPYIEVSAKTGHNVDVAFYDVVEAISNAKKEVAKKEKKKQRSRRCVIA